jgi:hypothetical protein
MESVGGNCLGKSMKDKRKISIHLHVSGHHLTKCRLSRKKVI